MDQTTALAKKTAEDLLNYARPLVAEVRAALPQVTAARMAAESASAGVTTSAEVAAAAVPLAAAAAARASEKADVADASATVAVTSAQTATTAADVAVGAAEAASADAVTAAGARAEAAATAAQVVADAADVAAARDVASAARDQAVVAASAAIAASIPLAAATWSNLAAIAGTTEGQRAMVAPDDVGTHADPVAGGAVANAGIYGWSASPAGWRRVADLVDIALASVAETEAGEVTNKAVHPLAVRALVDDRTRSLEGYGVTVETVTEAIGGDLITGSNGNTGTIRAVPGLALPRDETVKTFRLRIDTAGTIKFGFMRPLGGLSYLITAVYDAAAGESAANIELTAPANFEPYAGQAGDIPFVYGVSGSPRYFTNGAGLAFNGTPVEGETHTFNASSNQAIVQLVAEYDVEHAQTVKADLEAIQFSTDIEGLGAARLWADGIVIDASDPESPFYTAPVPLPPDGTANDAMRYRDSIATPPGAGAEVAVVCNFSPNWGAFATDCSGVRLPVGAFQEDQLLVVALGFVSGTLDTSPSKIVFSRSAVDPASHAITPVAAATLVTDAEAGVNKLVNPSLCLNPITGRLHMLFARDDRSLYPARGPKAELFELWSDDFGEEWQGDSPHTIGGTSASARVITGDLIDPAWSRFYPSPHPGIVDDDGVMFVPCWSVTGTTYHQWIAKGVPDGSGLATWSRIALLTEGANTGKNEDRIVGEQSVIFLGNGNLLLIGRPSDGWGGRYWWEYTKAGVFVATGFWPDFFSPPIGSGVCRLRTTDGRSRLLAVGPRIFAGSGQRDVGMHAAVSYDERETWLDGPDWEPLFKLARKSMLGVDLSAPVFHETYSGNNSLVPAGLDFAFALIERRGPTNAGTLGDYTCIGARPLTATNAHRNPEIWEG